MSMGTGGTMKILDKEWFTTGNDCIGIVLVETDFGERICYIKNTSGTDENGDTDMVLRWGARFPLAAAYALFPQHDPELDKNV